MVPSGTGFASLVIACTLSVQGVAMAAGAAEGTPGAAQEKPTAAELASARRLFNQALGAEDRGRWAEALEIYERVSRVAVSPSVHYHMGVCHEELGHLVEAINAYELAISSAESRREIALGRESRARLDAVRARTPSLTIALPDGAEGVSIELDGQPLNAALAGAPVPINPGERRVTVRADSHARPYEITLRVAAGDTHELRADLGPKKAPPASQATIAAPKRLPAPAPPPPPAPNRLPGFITGGAAIVLAAGAVATGVAAYGLREEYLEQNANPTPGSRDRRESLRNQGQALAITSTGLSGGALIAAGLATYLLWPSSPAAPKSSARITPWVGPTGAGIGVGGAL